MTVPEQTILTTIIDMDRDIEPDTVIVEWQVRSVATNIREVLKREKIVGWKSDTVMSSTSVGLWSTTIQKEEKSVGV